MFPVGLETISILLMALAVGCGFPALVYLAFRGNLREKSTGKSKPAKPTEEALSKVVGYMDAYVHVPVPVKGYLYVPIDFLEESLKRTGYGPTRNAEPKPEPEKPSKPSEQTLIKRVE